MTGFSWPRFEVDRSGAKPRKTVQIREKMQRILAILDGLVTSSLPTIPFLLSKVWPDQRLDSWNIDFDSVVKIGNMG
jgi:hypothetical protein